MILRRVSSLLVVFVRTRWSQANSSLGEVNIELRG